MPRTKMSRGDVRVGPGGTSRDRSPGNATVGIDWTKTPAVIVKEAGGTAFIGPKWNLRCEALTNAKRANPRCERYVAWNLDGHRFCDAHAVSHAQGGKERWVEPDDEVLR